MWLSISERPEIVAITGASAGIGRATHANLRNAALRSRSWLAAAMGSTLRGSLRNCWVLEHWPEALCGPPDVGLGSLWTIGGGISDPRVTNDANAGFASRTAQPRKAR